MKLFNNVMSAAEIAAAAEALSQWFESQNLDAGGAVPVMCTLMGAILRAGTKDRALRKMGVETISGMIADATGDQ